MGTSGIRELPYGSCSDTEVVRSPYGNGWLNTGSHFGAIFWMQFESNVQVVMESDDIRAQQGPMVSPETYRKLTKPAQKRVWQFSKKSKTKAFLFFRSCGSVRKFIPDFIELGIDILNPVQVAAKDMDPKELKSEFGKDLTFGGGGYDTQEVLPFGTSYDVEQEVKRRISELAPGGGFVFNQIHNIQPQVPLENIVSMFETVHKYGNYPIRV